MKILVYLVCAAILAACGKKAEHATSRQISPQHSIATSTVTTQAATENSSEFTLAGMVKAWMSGSPTAERKETAQRVTAAQERAAAEQLRQEHMADPHSGIQGRTCVKDQPSRH